MKTSCPHLSGMPVTKTTRSGNQPKRFRFTIIKYCKEMQEAYRPQGRQWRIPQSTRKKPNKQAQTKKPKSYTEKEYAFENWLLAIISPVLIINGVYVVMGKFGGADLNLGASGIKFIDFFFNTDLKRILTGSFLILVGTLVIVYLAIPILRPSIAEMKKVSWPTSKVLAVNTGRVFAFLLFLMLVFTLYGLALDPLFKCLLSL